MSIGARTSVVVWASALLVATAPSCSDDQARDAAPSEGGQAEVGAEAEAGGEAGDDAAPDSDAGALPGPVTFRTTGAEALLDRSCDFDGDGVGDNAIADLGGVEATLFAQYVGARIQGELEPERPLLVHLPWVEDLATLTDPDVVCTFLVGLPPTLFGSVEGDVPPEGPFFAHYHCLDGCGEPRFHSEAASLDHGRLEWTGGLFALPLAWSVLIPSREPELTGTITSDGERLEAAVCSYTTIADLGATRFTFEGEVRAALDLFVAGGRLMGVPTVPGLEPDVDLDGDGLEGFVVDGDGAIAACVDGDETVIDGADCWRDPRMADAFSATIGFAGERTTFGGRMPDWERAAEGDCPAGPPEPSLFDSAAFDDVGCAGFEERCEPFAPQPCCDADAVCTGLNEHDNRCFRPGCEAALCDYGTEPGLCELYAGDRACRPLWRTSGLTPYCEEGTEGCATEYGVSDGTVCASSASVGGTTWSRCYERCDVSSSGCERGYSCIPQRFADEALCVRRVPDE